ncbi:MAG: DUF4331 family protein [Myxococcales bacterium]|nr:DUF4331 family protein [Myxococcales bacterium]
MKLLNIAGLMMLASSLALVGCGDDDDGGGGKSGSGGSAGTSSAGTGGTGNGGSGGTGNGGSGGTGNAGAGGTTGGSGGSSGSAGTGGTGGTGGNFPAAPTLGAQIDRMGRPAVNTALISPLEADTTAKGMAKDGFNAKTPADYNDFVTPISQSLAAYDGLDTNCGNQSQYEAAGAGTGYATLANILAFDVLKVDTSAGTCDQFLAVELNVTGKCGGRTLTMDVIDSSYSVLTGADPGVVTDGVASDVDGGQTATFPFLAPPTN